jgi:methylmalonyl-CoA/ethylmalonyl-CoA epimerase
MPLIGGREGENCVKTLCKTVIPGRRGTPLRALLAASGAAAWLIAVGCQDTLAQQSGADARRGSFALRIHHVAIAVPDLNATVEWYREMLGFVPDRSFRVESERVSLRWVRRGDFVVEIFQFDEPRPVPSTRSDVIGDLRSGGLSHFAFAVRDVAGLVADLERRGVRIVVPVTEFQPGLPVAFIADNAGNLIELVQEDRK